MSFTNKLKLQEVFIQTTFFIWNQEHYSFIMKKKRILCNLVRIHFVAPRLALMMNNFHWLPQCQTESRFQPKSLRQSHWLLK